MTLPKGAFTGLRSRYQTKSVKRTISYPITTIAANNNNSPSSKVVPVLVLASSNNNNNNNQSPSGTGTSLNFTNTSS